MTPGKVESNANTFSGERQSIMAAKAYFDVRQERAAGTLANRWKRAARALIHTACCGRVRQPDKYERTLRKREGEKKSKTCRGVHGCPETNSGGALTRENRKK